MKSRLGIWGVSILPVVAALGIGAWLAQSASGNKQERAELARMEDLTAQSRILAEAVWENIDVIRARALSLQQLRAINPQQVPSAPILHWAELELKDGRISSVRQAVKNPTWKGDADYYLRSAVEQIGVRDVNEQGVTALRIREDSLHPHEWLALGFRSQTPQPSIVLALVDPTEAFPVFKRLAKRLRTTNSRAYLIGSDGQVLSHTQQNYSSTDFSGAPIFTEALRSIFQGTRTAGAGTFVAIDQLSVNAAYERLGSLPMGVVLEQPMDTTQNPLKIRFAGQLLGALGILTLLTLICARRKVIKKTESETETETVSDSASVILTTIDKPQVIPASQSKNVLNTKNPATEDHLNNKLLATEEALRSARDESSLVARFEADAARLKDPKKVGARLAISASQLCQSPVLFFTYQEALRSGVLAADAGFETGQAPASMNFPISDELMRQIVQSQRETDQSFSLANYPPLAHVLLSRVGVAHYEAWVITGYGHLGRVAGTARVLGFLVILQAGIESMTRYESVNRMMRATGLIYENTLLSQ